MRAACSVQYTRAVPAFARNWPKESGASRTRSSRLTLKAATTPPRAASSQEETPRHDTREQTSQLRQPESQVGQVALDVVHDLQYAFDFTFVFVVDKMDTDKLYKALERAVEKVPIVAGVLTQTEDDGEVGYAVEFDTTKRGVPFKVQTTDALEDRKLARLLDSFDGKDVRDAGLRLDTFLASHKNSVAAGIELGGPHRFGMDALLGEPVLKVQVTQARSCTVVALAIAHVIGDYRCFEMFRDTWIREYASLYGDGNVASDDSSPALWWDRSRFYSNLPSKCPGMSQASRDVLTKTVELIRERAERCKRNAQTMHDLEECFSEMRMSDSALQKLCDSEGGSEFENVMNLVSPPGTSCIGFAFDTRLIRSRAEGGSDSMQYFGNGATLVYGDVDSYKTLGGIDTGIGTVTKRDVRRCLSSRRDNTPALDDIKSGAWSNASMMPWTPWTSFDGTSNCSIGSMVHFRAYAESYRGTDLISSDWIYSQAIHQNNGVGYMQVLSVGNLSVMRNVLRAISVRADALGLSNDDLQVNVYSLTHGGLVESFPPCKYFD
ncbi:hypothetical protein NFJ02_01g41310 [Pycnococcus provasolii]